MNLLLLLLLPILLKNAYVYVGLGSAVLGPH